MTTLIWFKGGSKDHHGRIETIWKRSCVRVFDVAVDIPLKKYAIWFVFLFSFSSSFALISTYNWQPKRSHQTHTTCGLPKSRLTISQTTRFRPEHLHWWIDWTSLCHPSLVARNAWSKTYALHFSRPMHLLTDTKHRQKHSSLLYQEDPMWGNQHLSDLACKIWLQNTIPIDQVKKEKKGYYYSLIPSWPSLLNYLFHYIKKNKIFSATIQRSRLIAPIIQ